MSARLNVACLDLRQVSQFVYSVALARGLAYYTELKWVEYKDSAVLNLLYSAMPWKGKPGWVEVDTNVIAAREMAKKNASHYQKVFYAKLSDSPASASKYMIALEAIKEGCISQMQQVYRDASKINSDVNHEITVSMIELRLIKIGASLAVSYGSAGALPIAYTIATAVIDNWDNLEKAGLVAALDIGTSEGAKKAREIAGRNLTAQEELVREAKALISAKNAELMRKSSSRKIAKLGRQISKAQGTMTEGANSAARFANLERGAAVAGKVLPLVFAIPDVLDLIEDVRQL